MNLSKVENAEFAEKEDIKKCVVCGLKFVPIIDENYCSGLCKDELTGMVDDTI